MFRILDIILWPFMWVLGGFVFPVQETHAWHTKKWNWKKSNGLIIKGTDRNARFGHESFSGLLHMPILGGLTKYVVIEATGFNNYWYVGWQGQLHQLPIKENRIKLLTGRNGFVAYGLGDNGRNLKLRIVGFGELGDKEYEGIRLF